MALELRGASLRLCLLLTLLFSPGVAAGHPLGVEDLLKQEAFDFAAFDPSGRWLMLEVQTPYLQAASFENYYLSRTRRARILKVDLRRPGRPRLAFPQPRGGYLMGAFSPSGARLIVYRTRKFRREMGVLTLATGEVRWLGFGVEMDFWGATSVWRSEREILALALGPGDRPYQERGSLAAMLDLPHLWTRALFGGGATAKTLGSGALIGVYPLQADRRLLEVDVARGVKRVLARGPFESLSLSRSGDRLAVVRLDARTAPNPGTLLTADWAGRRRSLQVLDVSDGSTIALDKDLNVVPLSLRWSPSSALLFASGDQDALGQPAQLNILRPGRGRAEAIQVDPAGPQLDPVARGVHADWMSEDVLAFGRLPGRSHGDWFLWSKGGPINLTAAMGSPPAQLSALDGTAALAIDDTGLWRLSRDGPARNVLPAAHLSALGPIDGNLPGPAPIDEPGSRRGAFSASSGPNAGLFKIGMDGRVQPILLPADGPAHWAGSQSTRITATNGAFSVRVSRDAHGVDQVDLQTGAGKVLPLLTLNRHFATVDWAKPVSIDHPTEGGRVARDWVYLPPFAVAGHRYPLVVLGYPGRVHMTEPPAGRPGADQVDDNPQLIAAAGFAVLVPSLPRTGNDLVDKLPAAVEGAVDRASRVPQIDAARLGFWGHSAGGLLGYRLASETRSFGAIVAAAGISDLISFRGQTAPSAKLGPDWDTSIRYPLAWTERGQGGLQATPLTDLAHYERASPVLSAGKIETPLLIVQGDQDPASYAQAEEMFSALYRQGKDAMFVSFFGEGHTISSPPNMRLYFRTAVDFLSQRLGKGEPARARPERWSASPAP